MAAAFEDYLGLTHEQRLDLLVDLQRQKAALAATEQTLLHAIVVGYPDVELDTGRSDRTCRDREWVDEEIACVLRISSRTAGDRRATEEQLVTVLPDTLTALAEGRVSLSHALKLCDATLGLDDAVARKVEAEVLDKAERQTPGQFGASIRKAAARFDTHETEQKHTDARAERRVGVYPPEQGMADLYAHLPAEEVAAIWDQIQRCADAAAGDPRADRTADQRRADAFVDLLLHPHRESGTGSEAGTQDPRSGARDGVRPNVHLTVALSTLVGLDQQGAELTGHGPIPAVLARAIAADPNASWRRIVTDDNGQFLAEDATGFLDHIRQVFDAGADTYRPSAALDRHIRQRDQTCRFPGCRSSAKRGEVDHIVAWADGGKTTEANLQALCPRHHHLKHETRWRVHRNSDRSTIWTAPNGRRYTQPPPDPLPIDTTVALIDEPAPF